MGLEDDCPFFLRCFSGSMLIFRGVNHIIEAEINDAECSEHMSIL